MKKIIICIDGLGKDLVSKENTPFLHDFGKKNYFSELKTLRADGVLVYCNGKNICLLFYHHMKPYVSNNGSKKQKQINKCLIEIQMEPEHLNIVSGVIQAAIQTYQSKTEEIGNNLGEEKNPNTSMFV